MEEPYACSKFILYSRTLLTTLTGSLVLKTYVCIMLFFKRIKGPLPLSVNE